MVPVWDGASITAEARVSGVLVLAFRVALKVCCIDRNYVLYSTN